MDDLIKRQDAIDALEEQLDYLQMLNKDDNPTAESNWYGVNWARNTIAELPSPCRAEGEIDKSLCDSCITKGCIFQSGIVRKYCDFYKAERRTKVCIAKIELSEEELRQAVEKAVEEVKHSMPTVIEPEQRWIPCSERLPEECGDFLVTRAEYGWNCEYYEILDIAFYDGERWHKTNKVIAWMPLPEPYKE